MDGSVKSDARLDVSVSFGRFENDALSWEKWSSFSPNKYLEEIGTLSTPGSVAQKKAYFEAHYKKIAAKKAEEESEHDNHKFMYPIIPISNVSREENNVNSPDIDADSGSGHSNDQRPVEEVEQKSSNRDTSVEEVTQGSCVTSLSSTANCDDDDAEYDTGASIVRVEQETSVKASVDEIVTHEHIENDDVTVVESIIEEVKGSLIGSVADPKLGTVEELASVSMETSSSQKGSKKMIVKNSTPERKKGVERRSSPLNRGKTKVNSRYTAQKVNPINKEKDLAAVKKKVITPSSAKSLQASTPRQPRPTSSISITPISSASTQPLKKKVNSSSVPTSKKPVVGESKKKIAPTSLHMSLSLGSPNPSSAITTVTRKSLIMEKMGDKDIVKRAFKAFQNHLTADEKPVMILSPASQPKLATPRTPGKGNNQGPRKDAQKLASPMSQSATRSSSYPLPSSRNRKDLRAISPAAPVGLKTDDKAEKRREFLKKLEARSIARVAENARTQAKAKEDKDSGLKV